MGGPTPGPGQAFVKTWSENHEWAESLAQAIGGRKTGIYAVNGYVVAPLYEFDQQVLNSL